MDVINEKNTEEEIGNSGANKKKSHLGCFVVCILLFFIALAVGGVFYSLNTVNDNADDSFVQDLVYRDLQKSDVSLSYNSSLSAITITIQANTNIESFSAVVNIIDSNEKILESKNVSYNKMQSGSRYEVVFNLSFMDMLNASGYNVTDIKGKVKR